MKKFSSADLLNSAGGDRYNQASAEAVRGVFYKAEIMMKNDTMSVIQSETI